MMKTSKGIYIHIPFCKSKCPYCDFYSVISGKNSFKEKSERFIAALHNEIDCFNEESTVDTIYFGGGTPSLLETEQIRDIIERFRYSMTGDCEVTLELNPKTADYGKIKGFKEAGINRLSIGAQSFDDEILKKLGRTHRAEDIEEIAKAAGEVGLYNFSIDLMFGIEGQSMESWQESVRRAISLKPKHVSLYSLEFMEGTFFTKQLEAGKMKETEPELDREMYRWAIEELERSGIMQYEISNCAVEGFCSRHNMKYWNLDEYEGFGPSAHSYINHQRSSNNPDLEAYTAFWLGEMGEQETAIGVIREIYSENGKFDDMSEFAFTALRKNDGISLWEFERRFGEAFWEVFGNAKDEFMRYVESGHAWVKGNRIGLTLEGFNISNQILNIFV